MKIGKVYISCGFALLISILFYADEKNLLLSFLTSAFIHEAGHYLVLKNAGGRVKRFDMTALGFVMHTEEKRLLSYPQEIAALLAGPLISIVTALLSGFIANATGYDRIYHFAGVNFVFALYNLLPVKCLDGGRVLYFAVSNLSSFKTADAVLYVSSLITSVLACAAGIFVLYKTGTNFTLLAAGIWMLLSQIRVENN